MKWTSTEFKSLQGEWYKRLEESGFEDVEKFKDDKLTLRYFSSEIVHESDVERESRDVYFQRLSEALNDPTVSFKNETHWYIMTRHAEGAMIQEIVKELISLGMRRERKSVGFIIRRYEMKWKIRYYSRKQLNLKN